MKRNLLAALAFSMLASAPVFAQSSSGGIGHAGSYQTQPAQTASGKTRAEVKAELVAAYRDGSLPALNRTTYPNKGLIGQTQAERIALQEGTNNEVTRLANKQ
jgi:outer membrane protein W